MTGMRSALAVIAVMLSSTACASTATPTDSDPFDNSGSEARSVRLMVQNMNFSDVRLFAIRRGSRTSLGVVSGKRDAEFTLDWPLPEPLQIEIRLLAGPHCLTREMEVDPGDVLELQISSVFSQTSACR